MGKFLNLYFTSPKLGKNQFKQGRFRSDFANPIRHLINF